MSSPGPEKPARLIVAGGIAPSISPLSCFQLQQPIQRRTMTEQGRYAAHRAVCLPASSAPMRAGKEASFEEAVLDECARLRIPAIVCTGYIEPLEFVAGLTMLPKLFSTSTLEKALRDWEASRQT